MKRILLALLLLSQPARGQEDVVTAPKSVRQDAFPRQPVAFPQGVLAWPDVEYANLTGYRPLLLDLYLPRKDGKSHPLVVWVHGGGWNRGDGRTSGAIVNYPATLASLAAQGYVVASVNYRLSGEARFPAALKDVKAAIGFLRANAGQYDIDPGRALIWGGSAGGHLAALAAETCGVAEFSPEPNTGRLNRDEAAAALTRRPSSSDCVQAAVIWYGVFDLSPFESVRIWPELGCASACPDEIVAASPIKRVSAKTPPMLLVHGLDDSEVPPVQTRAMAAKLKEVGVPVETLLIPDVDHGLIGKTPQATHAATLLALQRTFAFIDKTFGR